MFIHTSLSIHPVMLCKIYLCTKYIHFHLFTKTTKAIYSIIQDNLVHKRVDCVNIVLSFYYQIQKTLQILLFLLYAVSKKKTHIYYHKFKLLTKKTNKAELELYNSYECKHFDEYKFGNVRS